MYMHSGLHGAVVETVLSVQKALKAKGFDPGPLDGKMGPKTKSAIVNFQKANGLAADGIVGPKTSAKLFTSSSPMSTAALTQAGALAASLLTPQGAIQAAKTAAHAATSAATKSVEEKAKKDAAVAAGVDVLLKAAGIKKQDEPLPPLNDGDRNSAPTPPTYREPTIFEPSNTPISERPTGASTASTTPAMPQQDWIIPAILGVGAIMLLMSAGRRK